jgi:hypothetical protein
VLRGEFTDASMMRAYDRLASLFTPDGAWRIPESTSSSSAGRRSAPESKSYRAFGVYADIGIGPIMPRS